LPHVGRMPIPHRGAKKKYHVAVSPGKCTLYTPFAEVTSSPPRRGDHGPVLVLDLPADEDCVRPPADLPPVEGAVAAFRVEPVGVDGPLSGRVKHADVGDGPRFERSPVDAEYPGRGEGHLLDHLRPGQVSRLDECLDADG